MICCQATVIFLNIVLLPLKSQLLVQRQYTSNCEFLGGSSSWKLWPPVHFLDTVANRMLDYMNPSYQSSCFVLPVHLLDTGANRMLDYMNLSYQSFCFVLMLSYHLGSRGVVGGALLFIVYFYISCCRLEGYSV